MEILRIIAGSDNFCLLLTVSFIALLTFITVNRAISGSQRAVERRLNIDAEAARMKKIGDRTGHHVK